MTLTDSEASDEDVNQANNNMDCDPTFAGACSSNEPPLLIQGDLNDIVRDWNLSKQQAEHSGSRLNGWILLREDTKVCFYRRRREKFKDFFSQEDGVVFCNDVCSVMELLGHVYNPDQWLLCIDLSKVSLKVVLLHNGNKFPSAPLAHAANMKIVTKA
jgi:pterin-4a-carbinolamine dehydratase